MQINTDLSSDTLALSLQQKRAEASGPASQSSAATPPSAPASQLDPLLQRLTDAPSPIEAGDFDLQDGTQATHVMNSLVQSIRLQPGTAMAAQANQFSDNVLSLLQPTD